MPETAFDYSTAVPIDQGEDNSIKVSQPFDYSTAQPIEEGQVAPDVPAMSDYLKFKYKQGKATMVRGGYGRAAMFGEMPLDEAVNKANTEYLDQLDESGQLEDIAFRDAPIKSMLGSAANMMPIMISGMKEGLAHGVVMGGGFATIAGVAGAAGPQVLTPEEIVTVPGAFAAGMGTGMTFGILKNSMDIEGGNLFIDLIEKGADPQTAQIGGLVGGLGIGLLEVGHFKLLTAPLKRTFIDRLRNSTVKGIIAKSLMKYAGIVGGEVTIEEAQEIVSITTETLAGIVDDNPNAVPTREDIANRLIETGQETLKAMAVIGLPGSSVSATRAFVERGQEAAEVQESVEAPVEPGIVEESVQEVTDQEIDRMSEIGEEKGETIPQLETDGIVQPEAIPQGKQAIPEPIPEGIEAEIEFINQIGQEITEKGEISQEFFRNALDQNLQSEIAQFEKREGKRLSTLDKAKMELKNIDATIQAVQETPEFSEMGKELFEGKQDLLKSLRADKKILQEKIKGLQPKKIVKTETRELKDKIKNIQRGFRQGKVKTKKEIKSVQKEINKLLDNSDLEANDRDKFRKTIQNIQTVPQLKKKVGDIIDRINEIERDRARSSIINSLKKQTETSKIKKLRPEFKKPVQSIIKDFDFSKPSDRKIKQLNSLKKFLQENEDNQVPQSRLNELERLSKTPLRDMSLEDVETVAASVQHFLKLNDLKNKIIVGRKIRDFTEVRKKSIENVQTKHEKLNESLDGLDTFQEEQESKILGKSTQFLKNVFTTWSYNAELKTEILDGEEAGVIKEVIYKGIDEGVSEQYKFQHEAQDYFKENLKGINLKKKSKAFNKKKVDIDIDKISISGGREITLTKGERIAFNLHTRNQNNMRHLVNGGYAFPTTPSKIVKLTEDDIAKIANIKGDDLKVANVISEYLNTVQKNKINEVSVDINGFEIAIETEYFPIRTNFLDRFKENLVKSGNFIHASIEGLGIFKERQKASNAIILEDAFLAVYKSVHQTSAYVGLAKPLRSAKALLNDNQFQISVRDIGRKSYIDSLRKYIDRIEGASIEMENVEKLTQELINKLDVSILGVNPFVIAKQPISYMNAMTEMDEGLLRDNFKLKPTEQELSEIRKYAPQLRDRLDGNVTREMGEVAQVGRPMKFWTGDEVLSNKIMEGIRRADTSAISSIWRSVKEEVKKNNPNLNVRSNAFFEKVADRAWEVIRKTQPTFHVKDRSDIGMSRQLIIRLATKYSSQRNKNFMIQRRALERYNRSHKTPKDKAQLAKAFTIINLVAPLMLMLVDESRDRIFARADKKSLFKRSLEGVNLIVGNIYFLGIGFSSLVSKIDRGTYAGYDIDDPVGDTVNDATSAIAEAVRAVVFAVSGEKYKNGRLAGEEKWRNSLKRASIQTLDTSGRISGIPVATARKFISGTIKNIKGDKQKSKFKK